MGRELYGLHEIAEALETPRATVTSWYHRRKFLPEPSSVLAAGPVWTGEAIEPWIRARRRAARKAAAGAGS